MRKAVAIIGTRGYPSYYGGFETAVRKLAPYLAERGWDVTVYGRKGSTRIDDPSFDRRVKTPVTRGIEKRSVSTLSYGFTATLDAVRKKPDVALVMNVANGYFLPLLRARSIPTLVNVDGIEWDRAKWGRLAKSVFRRGAKWTARHGDRMVYDSLAIAERWQHDFGLQGDFIPYGGDVPEALPVQDGLEHRGYVLVVARFVPENTVPEFIAAIRKISVNIPVVMVGSTGYGGDLDDSARELTEQRSNVMWLGHVSDDSKLLSLWQHAAVYFHGHSVGGTNPALVQAMACGAPVLARDTIYNREVLADTGMFVEPDASEIALAIERLFHDANLQKELSEKAASRAELNYSWDAVNHAYETALLNLIDGARK
jgi:glycosyltransferase involved in cell wall biosynthesis